MYDQLYYSLYNSLATRQVDDNPTNTYDKSTKKFLVDGSTNGSRLQFELCPMTAIFLISTYIGCNRLMYNPDHLLFSVLISTGYNPDLFQPKQILGRYWFFLYPRNIGRSRYRSVTTQTDSNRFLFWVVIDFISTPEISVVVVIDLSRPRPIPSDTYSGSLLILSLPLKYYNPGYNYKPITTQIGYNLELFWVVIKIDYDRYRS